VDQEESERLQAEAEVRARAEAEVRARDKKEARQVREGIESQVLSGTGANASDELLNELGRLHTTHLAGLLRATLAVIKSRTKVERDGTIAHTDGRLPEWSVVAAWNWSGEWLVPYV